MNTTNTKRFSDRPRKHAQAPSPDAPLAPRIAKARFEADASSRIAAYVLDRYGLTQAGLAELLGVDQSYVSRVARGQRSFTFAHLDAMGQALGVPMAVLVWRALRPPPPGGDGAQVLDAVDDLLRTAFPEFAEDED